MKKINGIVLGGMLSALAVIIMLLSSLIQTLDLSAAALAGFAVSAARLKIGKKWGYIVYAVSGLLAFLLLPVKTAAVFFIIGGGIYPMLKPEIERIRIRSAAWTVKLVYFNTVMLAVVFFGTELLFKEAKPEGIMLLGACVFGNAAFILYDIALKRLEPVFASIFGKR